jgi:hypothetical protein
MCTLVGIMRRRAAIPHTSSRLNNISARPIAMLIEFLERMGGGVMALHLPAHIRLKKI